MASISKLSTAFLSVPNEITVAAANFNLNFSLMKFEAPPEFHGLRDALSRKRLHEAEEGVSHVTARCLGALFESVIPPIPHLTAVYGIRVSEITSQLQTTTQQAGMFADRAGADGTSIWAAATSGKYAIPIHLLACMLARIWKPAEAISLWVELVERRKQEIFKAYDASRVTGIPSIMAAQQLFNREQLSAWDASARSWLRTADRSKRLNHTQLTLIIDNLRLPVNSSKDPYDSVISAWTSALTTMERLICGTPQRVQDGAVLLAISSWHLYPNMQVLHDSTKEINPGDELMARSMLTVSLHGANDGREGVFWSLPLSRMRYYSPAIISERSLASDTSRISMEEFQIVFLGAFVARWKRVCPDETRWCTLIVSLDEAYQRFGRKTSEWFKILVKAALRVISSSGYLHAQHLKLLRLGSRRCQGFLHDAEFSPPAFFALEYFHVLIRALNCDEERVKLLRQAAESRKSVGSKVIIRYKSGTQHHYASVSPRHRTSYKRSAEEHETPSTGHQRFSIGQVPESEVTCSGPEACGCIDPTADSCICKENGARCNYMCHESPLMCSSADMPLPSACEARCQDLGTNPPCVACYNQLKISELEKTGEEAILIDPNAMQPVDEFQFQLKRPGDRVMSTYGLLLGHGDIAAVFQEKSQPTYDTYHQRPSDSPSATIEEIESAVASKHFDPLYLRLDSCCYHWDNYGFEQQMKSLKGLTFASSIYASMPDATVSIEVITQPLYTSHWVTDYEAGAGAGAEYSGGFFRVEDRAMWWHRDEDDHSTHPVTNIYDLDTNLSLGNSDAKTTQMGIGTSQPYPINLVQSKAMELPASMSEESDSSDWGEYGHKPRFSFAESASFTLKRAFSCIAWFESGDFDMPLHYFDAVMASVSGDSIYVASALLADPSVTQYVSPVQRVFGNIGRSEMCLLIPPADPRLAEPDLRSWKQVNHADFDGTFENCFGSTTLHLTFTDSEDTVFIGNRGLRDRQVIMVEALVSIDDRGKNVGDLDILSMFAKPHFVAQKACCHNTEQRTSPTLLPLLAPLLTSIDCWEEFLDPPIKPGIVRASGNWQARLGAAAAAVQMSKKVTVLPEQACLQCLRDISLSSDCVIIA